MKNKKEILLTILLIIAIIIIIVMGVFIYMHKVEADTQIAEPENNDSEIQEEIDSEVQQENEKKSIFDEAAMLEYTTNMEDDINGKIAILKMGEDIFKTKIEDDYYTYIDNFSNSYQIKEITEITSSFYMMGVDNWAALYKCNVNYLDNNNTKKEIIVAVILPQDKKDAYIMAPFDNYTGSTSFVTSFVGTIEEETAEENIILYKGIEISNITGIQTVTDMEIDDSKINKYNTTYYNYENGKYEGTTIGDFGEETYEGFSIVSNVKKIAITQNYNAIPREYTVIEELPEQLSDMADYSSVVINEIDLDGDGNKEHLVCYTINYDKGEIGDGEPQASSGIMLFDNNYNKIADLVTLENGFWANIKEEEYKVFLSLEDVEYIDIDNDGIMEIIIQIPTYEVMEINIIKYSDSKIEGEINVQASLEA